MKNVKLLKAHCEKVYNQRIKQAKRAKSRLDSRGLRVEMTPAGLKAEIRKLEKRKAAALARINADDAYKVDDGGNCVKIN